MSQSVSRASGWVLSACLSATLPAAFAQAAPSPAAAPPPAQTAPSTTPQTAPATPAPAARVAPPEAPAAARYDNTYEISGGFAYDHLHVSPPLPEGANLGGINIIGTRWFTDRLAAAASVRGYYGTTGATPNIFRVAGPSVNQYLFLGGPEVRGPHNQNFATSVHALFGAGKLSTESDLKGHSPAILGILPSQTAFASAIGGSLDVNRSPRLAYRVTPELIVTRYSGAQNSSTQYNLGFTAGILYRFLVK